MPVTVTLHIFAIRGKELIDQKASGGQTNGIASEDLMVISHLPFANTIFNFILEINLTKLKSIQNCFNQF